MIYTTPTAARQVARILRRAAEKIANGGALGMCLAIYRAGSYRYYIDTLRLTERVYLKGSPYARRAYWMGPIYDSECDQHRVIALLMLADAVEQGDF